MSRLHIALVILCLITKSVSHRARILGLFPFPAKSHIAISASLMLELANRGHQVTVIRHYPEDPPHPNITDVTLGEVDYRQHKLPESLFEIRGAFKYILSHWEMGISITDKLLEDAAVQNLIHSEDKIFDVIITEAFFNEAFLGFAHKFKAPVIQISTIDGASWVGDWFGNSAPYSYVPNNYLSYGDHMDFSQRIMNTIVGSFFRLGRHFYYLQKQDYIMKKHFCTLHQLPPLYELEKNTRLILLNHHFSLSSPKPLMPNMVPIAGMIIKTPKALPQDLQRFMDEASDGVIFFSMGTHLRITQMPVSTVEAFLKTFSELKQRIIWKFENDTLPRPAENVKVDKFLPQFDILNHPNMRLFITHCGVSSTQEAAYIGVPIIGLPVFGDQGHNCAKFVKEGSGILLDYENITTASFTSAIQEVLKTSYRENVQRLSRIFRDQPLKPLEQAVFWTEYVIRHKGAPHMRSAALDLTWYQYLLLDVIAVLVLVAACVLIGMLFLLRVLMRKVCCSSRKEKTN